MVQTQVVRFNKSTGASGTTQDVALNFTPKAIIVFSHASANDASAVATYINIIGFSDGTNQICQSLSSDDASAAGDAARVIEGGRVWVKLGSDNPFVKDAHGTCVFITNGVRFTWTLNDAIASIITIWAIGGDEISAKVNSEVIGRTTVGSRDYTGLGFNPSDGHSALFMVAANSNAGGLIIATVIGSFGCATKTVATDAANQWYMGNVSENLSDPSDTWRVAGNDRCMAVMTTTGGFAHYCYLINWITDGFRLYWDGPPASSDIFFQYLVINGGNWDSGTLTTPAVATNNVDKAVSVDSKTIRGLFTGGVTSQISAAIGTYALYSLGVTDGTTHSVTAAIDEDAQATTDGYRYSDGTSIYYSMGVDGVVAHRATFDSFGTNNFRLDYPVMGAAHMLHWVVVADSATAYTRAAADTVTNSDAITSKRKRPIADSITSSSTLTTKRKRPITQTVTVSDALTKIKTFIRTILE